MGLKSGKNAAERWKTAPEGKNAQEQRELIASANKRRAVQGQGSRGRVLPIYAQTLFDTGSAPPARQIAEEIGCKRNTPQEDTIFYDSRIIMTLMKASPRQ